MAADASDARYFHFAMRWGPALTAASVAARVALAIGIFRGAGVGRRRRAVAVLLVAPIVAAAIVARRNISEWIFPAAEGFEMVPATAIADLRDDDMVMGTAVRLEVK